MILKRLFVLPLWGLCTSALMAQNPIVSHCFTADPAPVVHEGIDSLYVYCDEDMNVSGVNDFYYMERYRVYSTADMVNWTDHGDAMPRTTFKWMKEGTCWASQCVKRGNYYYWYMCGNPAPGYNYGYNVIGVGRSKTPSGPFTDPIGKPIISAFGYIDPTVLIDDDNQAYLYFGNPQLSYVKLNTNMTSYKTTGGNKGVFDIPLTEATVGGYKDANDKIVGVDKYEEGPWLDKRGDNYYMIYAAGGVPEHISYSMAKSPTGPWEYKGQVMRQQNTGSFTNHSGIVNFRGHEYFFYHTGWLTGGGGFNRSMSVEEFQFNEDGTIPEIKATKTGVKALSTLNPFIQQQAETMNEGLNIKVVGNEKKGVYVTGITSQSTIRVANVDFGEESPTSITIRYATALDKGYMYVRLNSKTGTQIARIPLQSTGGENVWEERTIELSREVTGVKKIYFTFSGTANKESGILMNFDWWKFNTAEETGIATISHDEDGLSRTPVYDLSGRQVPAHQWYGGKAPRGIYVKNGKKVVR
ncbi:MAG: family 43 glycosylhydrolase [Bacteroidaceae bacterium]|nr:family 43 glycosylhydrolase [Bacteroidaceae bacterium]